MTDETPETSDTATPATAPAATAPAKELPPAAQRALAEAEERRRAAAAEAPAPKEYGGRDGLDPARYGDWEKKGIAIDF
ncbi:MULTISPECIES: DUF1674 domain-containing protein [Salipiger]|jgi:hypothetical protein|uniref:Putative conserved small protein n=1 Tax=Salipiger profundus TaxID=1229727 RepID=A0A1U7CZZ7_9RHOB|nr:MULTISPECIES: DUF1674 domain-containing protein [Salipiger]APX21452.1 putative conserved small protein [Salipiger profundus]GGA02285.1 hypothetical protein GCM10011326_12000 [Salipiger profundus]SFC20248.1 hypothetical protein SAMN05444415_102358 [Salipiger profundus]